MINIVQILGRVSKINHKVLANSNSVTNFSVLTSKKVTKDGERQEKVTWHNVTVFNKLSELMQKYVNEGDYLWIQGEIEHQKYTGQDGVEKTKTVIIGHDIRFMPRGKPQQEVASQPVNNSFEDSAIPF